MQNKQARGFDWLSIALVFLLIQVALTRLVVTRWTEHLILAQSLATFGFWIGLPLGYSQFRTRAVVWLALGYSLILIPWQFTLVIQGDVLLWEKLTSVGGRLLFALGQFFRREPVEDGLLFVAFISIVAWSISLVSSYFWGRHRNYLATVLPAGIFILIIQLYDAYDNSRIILVGIYLLLALVLLGRVYYLKNSESWRARRVFQIQEATYDLTRGIIITATIIVVIAWTIPASASGWQSAVQTWSRFTKPWRNLQEWFSNAVDSLEATGPGSSGDLYGNRLNLGLGNPLEDTVLFTVTVPAIDENPPRYYWRGFVYDFYDGRSWSNSFPVNEDFEPSEDPLFITDKDGRTPARFTIATQIRQSLLYIPTQPSWVSRPGKIRSSMVETGVYDITAWFADPGLAAGERFEVEADLANPSIQDLQAAGSDVPAWVQERYLQLPEDFSPDIRALAEDLTRRYDTPYDKTVAITNYLRREITYANPLPEAPPKDTDIIEWMLFESRVGFCNYYATAEVVMLRAIGIPARMAVGFAEGEYDTEENAYTVRSLDSHAWPEVYFPDIGWIEFEPTGNQDALLRPDRPESGEPSNASGDGQDSNGSEGDNQDLFSAERNFSSRGIDEELERGIIETPQQEPLSPLLTIGMVLLFGVLLWGLDRKYALIARLPTRLQKAYEHNGGQAPTWIQNWARWNTLTSIERSYETINRSLRLLGEFPGLHATPSERSQTLTKRLPSAARPIKTLVAQHQASLFSTQPGHARLAKRASFAIWVHTFRKLFEEFIKGLDERFSGGQFT